MFLLLCGVVLGLAVGGAYGESWDEYGDYTYGEQSLRAYVRPDQLAPHFDQGYYGPFYLMLGSVTSDILPRLRAGWLASDGRHFSSYLTFLAGCFFFYLIMRRFTFRLPSLLATLLFSSQPLLFGSSFINQKDVPFMAFFTATVAVGLLATDVWGRQEERSPEGRQRRGVAVTRRESLESDWRMATTRQRAGLVFAFLGGGLLAFDLLARLVILPWLLNVVRSAYDGTAPQVINELFRLVAQDAYKTPVDRYLDKAFAAYVWLTIPAFVLAFLPAAVLVRRIYVNSLDAWGRKWLGRQLVVLSAGVILGLCTSVRVAGPFAGALVSLVFLARLGRASLPPLALYWGTAGLATLASWPFLWADPLHRFWESVRLMSRFGSHTVLYNGSLVSSLSLPWHYLPTLTFSQLTLPALFLGVFGVLIAVIHFRRRSDKRIEYSIIGLWLGLPTAAVIFFHRPLYGTFRQILFIMPPIFILSGVGLGWFLEHVRAGAFRAGLILLVLAPGIIGMLALHPYEYIYYNPIIGGTDGAAGRFELDYWCTSYRRAADFVNGVADHGATVAVEGPDAAFNTFARRDLTVKNSAIVRGTPDYAVDCDPLSNRAPFYPNLRTVYKVERGNAVLAVVKAAN